MRARVRTHTHTWRLSEFGPANSKKGERARQGFEVDRGREHAARGRRRATRAVRAQWSLAPLPSPPRSRTPTWRPSGWREGRRVSSTKEATEEVESLRTPRFFGRSKGVLWSSTPFPQARGHHKGGELARTPPPRLQPTSRRGPTRSMARRLLVLLLAAARHGSGLSVPTPPPPRAGGGGGSATSAPTAALEQPLLDLLESESGTDADIQRAIGKLIEAAGPGISSTPALCPEIEGEWTLLHISKSIFDPCVPCRLLSHCRRMPRARLQS